MYRIGIIGTENSHALHFARYFNLPDPKTGKMHHDDVRVVAILGDEESTSTIVRETGVEFVAEKPEDFFGRVDAVMITCRKGSLHREYALPFVEKGMPLFIDKPFTSNPAEAEDLMARIKASGSKVMGGSGCKYPSAIKEIHDLVADLRSKGEFMSAAMNFRVILDSPYDGLYFYAPHLVEMCLACFGYDVKTVQMTRTGDNMIVTAQYESDAVSLHFVSAGKEYTCVVYGKEQNYTFDIDMSPIYSLEAGYFADMLHGEREPLTEEQLVRPIHMLAAIVRSGESGKREPV